jgi:hypothetical protein
MRLLNQRYPARLKRIDRKSIRKLFHVLSLALIFLAGCSGGTSGSNWFSNFFSGASPTPSPTIEPVPTATPSPSPSPVAEEAPERAGKKSAKQARSASENAPIASKEAANASAAAALASKQAASVANRIEGSTPSNADVSLESNPGNNPAMPMPGAPAVGAIGNRATPASSPALAMADPTSSAGARMTPGASTPALESREPSADSAKAEKLIQDVDRMARRIDRKNLSGDDSQRDILAQKLLQEANKALADRDSVAAISLATKASTLFEPLPKLADAVTPSAP